MSKTIVLKGGLNIPISGEASKCLSKTIQSKVVAVQPGEFKGILPRLLVKEGDTVKAGSPVLADKKNPDIIITAPASGTVKEIVRGEKRKLLAVHIQTDDVQQYVDFGKKAVDALDAAQVKAALLESGLWATIVERPYGIIADPAKAPKGIFVSAFCSTPCTADPEYAFAGEVNYIQTAVKALGKIADVHISFDVKTYENSIFQRISGAEHHLFKGKNPAGNVGVQISHISPIKKGETVWTVSLAGLAAIGKLFLTGRYDVRRKVAIAGPMAIETAYISAIPGMPITDIKPFYGSNVEDTRFVSGDMLSGKNVGEQGYLGYFDNTISLIREGYDPELLGWVRPFRFKQYSNDRTYFKWMVLWLTPKRRFEMTTNLHGGPRAFVMPDSYYAKFLPMDIFPLYLIKACLAGDIDKMEKFGIYEVLPEDFAVLEFADPSKNYIQDIIAKGIDLMLKEMA